MNNNFHHLNYHLLRLFQYWYKFGTLKLAALHLSKEKKVIFIMRWIIRESLIVFIKNLFRKDYFLYMKCHFLVIAHFFKWNSNKTEDMGYNPFIK